MRERAFARLCIVVGVWMYVPLHIYIESTYTFAEHCWITTGSVQTIFIRYYAHGKIVFAAR